MKDIHLPYAPYMEYGSQHVTFLHLWGDFLYLSNGLTTTPTSRPPRCALYRHCSATCALALETWAKGDAWPATWRRRQGVTGATKGDLEITRDNQGRFQVCMVFRLLLCSLLFLSNIIIIITIVFLNNYYCTYVHVGRMIIPMQISPL